MESRWITPVSLVRASRRRGALSRLMTCPFAQGPLLILCDMRLSVVVLRNIVFFSTNCTEGIGKGVVVRTGDNTAIGAIASVTVQGEKPETLMKQEIERFVHIISGIAVGIGLVFFIIAVIIGDCTHRLLSSILKPPLYCYLLLY
jgi:magnesium-transporting ATPase (P-type)